MMPTEDELLCGISDAARRRVLTQRRNSLPSKEAFGWKGGDCSNVSTVHSCLYEFLFRLSSADLLQLLSEVGVLKLEYYGAIESKHSTRSFPLRLAR
jgi:hypothetical protein